MRWFGHVKRRENELVKECMHMVDMEDLEVKGTRPGMRSRKKYLVGSG